MREEKMIEEIQKELFALQDTTYRDFQAKLIPGLADGSMIGVRTPKDFAQCMDELTRFLPYVDNWATCDQLSPKIFKKHRQELLPYIREWIASDKTYVVRFAIGMLMEHFLDEDFDLSYPELVSKVRSEEYYINMMIAWYFATALAKQYEAVLPYIEESRLAPWTHNKAIQKAIESNRITAEQKAYLRGLKMVVKKA